MIAWAGSTRICLCKNSTFATGLNVVEHEPWCPARTPQVQPTPINLPTITVSADACERCEMLAKELLGVKAALQTAEQRVRVLEQQLRRRSGGKR